MKNCTPRKKLRHQLDVYLQEMPVIGFSSGKYDINAVKPYLMSHIQNRDKTENTGFVVKKNGFVGT